MKGEGRDECEDYDEAISDEGHADGIAWNGVRGTAFAFASLLRGGLAGETGREL